MRRLKGPSLLIVSLLMTVFLVGSHTTPATAQTKVLKVGFVHNLGFSLGRDAQKLLEGYVQALNEKGGVAVGKEKYRVDLIVYDSKFSAELGRAAVERLVNQDRVKFIIGDMTADAWLPITEANGVVVLAATPSPAIYRKDLKYAFQTSNLGTMPSAVFGWLVKNRPQKKMLGMICTDDIKGHNDAKQLETLSKFFGITIKDIVFYAPDQSDFSAIATRMKAANPELISLAGGGSLQDSLALKSLRQAGWKGTLFNYRGITPDQYKKVVPLEQLEGAIFPVEGIHLNVPLRPIARELVDSYIAKFGKWDAPSCFSTSGFYVLLAALKQAQSLDTAKVAAAIGSGLRADTPQGPMVMVARPDLGNNKTVDAVFETYIHTIENGKLKALSTISTEEAIGYINKSGVFKAK